jgi:hypothetical protein
MKTFAYAALAVFAAWAGAALLSTPLDAKGSAGVSARASFRPNIGPLARRGHPVARNIGPLAGRYLARHFHPHGGRHHRNGYGYGDWGYGYSDYGYSDYGYSSYPYGPDSYADDAADAPPPPPRIARPVIRTVENSKDVCPADAVKVPATGGGETTVTILRCY